jgi:sulfite reductase (ferredoxin)
VLEKQIGFPLLDLASPVASPLSGSEHIGIWPQKDGNNYVGFAPRAGRISGHQLRSLAVLAGRYGDGRLRTTTQQKVVIVGVPPQRTEELGDELATLGLPVKASKWRSGTMACTGIEFCKLAIVETKGRAQEIYRYLEERMPGFNEDIRINVNGCPNSCARYQTADIGLMGCQVVEKTWMADHAGDQIETKRKVEAFLVHLGGHLGADRSFGRKAKGVKLRANEAGPYIETLVRRYRKQRVADDTFASFIARLDDKELANFAAKPEFHDLPPAPSAHPEPRAS